MKIIIEISKIKSQRTVIGMSNDLCNSLSKVVQNINVMIDCNTFKTFPQKCRETNNKTKQKTYQTMKFCCISSKQWYLELLKGSPIIRYDLFYEKARDNWRCSYKVETGEHQTGKYHTEQNPDSGSDK